jgi:hypothetical protein
VAEQHDLLEQLEIAGEELGHLETSLEEARAMYQAEKSFRERLQVDRDKIVADAHQMTQDLQQIAQELGIGAKPYSGHEAMERDILPEIRRLRQIEAVYNSIVTRKVPASYMGNPTNPS